MLTVKQIAEVLKVTPAQVRKGIRSGDVQPSMYGTRRNHYYFNSRGIDLIVVELVNLGILNAAPAVFVHPFH